MQLNFQIFGESGQALVIVHGLFGSLSNWRAVARDLSQTYQVYVIDQRNHGDSPQADSMTYHDMANDLNEFISRQGLKNYILCGHSMGGKAAMHFALSDFESVQLLNSLIILDIAPEAYTHSHEEYLAALHALDMSLFHSRAEVDQALKSVIPDTATRLFLLQSLTRKDDQFSWKINIPVLREYMSDIVGFAHAELEKNSNVVATLFLSGSASDYVQPYMHGRIQSYFPNASFASVDAGHWLHVEQRDEMLFKMRQFLSIRQLNSDL